MVLHDLVDIGANLTAEAFAGDVEAVLARARDSGVGTIVVTGSSERESARARDLALRHPGRLYSTAGVHPHHASDCGAGTIPALRELAVGAKGTVVAIGECGLDFYRDLSPRPVQEQWFEAHLELAAELGLPLFLHERDASARFTAIVAAHRPRLTRAVVHCFTGDRDALSGYLDLDLHIGITGWICDERRGTHLRELVREVPASRLMIETDAPYLLPRTIRPRPHSRRNEPMYLRHVLAAVAECRGDEPAAVAASTTATARAFFGLPDRA